MIKLREFRYLRDTKMFSYEFKNHIIKFSQKIKNFFIMTLTTQKPPKHQSFLNMLMVGGTAGFVAELATLPLDTTKVRMQVFQKKYKSTF